jgi:biotin carboxyl carrier protein
MAAPDTTGCIPVRSPAVGSFWIAPSPGAPPFTEPGRTVAEGDQLAIVEVMKLMNPVLAPQAGEVVQICAANAELVEYEQILFLIRPPEPKPEPGPAPEPEPAPEPAGG